MTESSRIVYRGGTGEITEKKSRFIADIRPVSTEEEALAFIEEIRKKYWDARHHCYAYILGERGQQSRCSDDGEPSQTAGRPMLDVLTGEGLTDVCAVVTRYFGGTLLGTGGLVRAYSGAVKEGLSQCVLMEKRPGRELAVTAGYGDVGKVQYLAAQAGIETLDTVYEADVRFSFLVSLEEEGGFVKKLTEGTAGRAKIQPGDQVFYGMGPDGLVVFR
ncbi:MAG TPA: YigZ family protein [Candidatus Enterocloster excrementipullorum]|uniref:YigZ family protein n=1 Tax=Candidatus Enterocloster excrementipullorum TaxID=2838559 RepID=A0A9D2MZ02_9FIRM|nr:YigZ family protein [Candidatus Enterocloster excrementipullorum]